MKVCTKCRRELPLEKFHRRKDRNFRPVAACRDCKQKQNNNWKIRKGLRFGTGEHHRTPKASRSPLTTDLYWAAGFLEGEASFGGREGRVQIAVSQCNREPLDRLQTLFGGTVRPGAKRYVENPNWTPQFRWGVSGARARGVMLTLFLLLSLQQREKIRRLCLPLSS